MDEEPSEKSSKEVYAWFGLAYFHSECLHRELCHSYVFTLLPEPALVTRPRFEEALVRAYSLTLGQVIEELKEAFDQSLFDRLKQALDVRNFLAHHFWFERSYLMHSEAGLAQMRRELEEASALFHSLDLEVTEINRPRRREVGISDEELQASIEATKAGIPMPPLPLKRPTKKREQLVRAWKAPSGGTRPTLVFETGDGLLLRLCDAGLEWAYFDEPEPTWTINTKIQQYLPATVPSRPSCSVPWSYDLVLKSGMVLSVRPSKRGISYRLVPQQ